MEMGSKMPGHSNVNMRKKYAGVVDDLISRDMQKRCGIMGLFQTLLHHLMW
jgi:hypothetical protein